MKTVSEFEMNLLIDIEMILVALFNLLGVVQYTISAMVSFPVMENILNVELFLSQIWIESFFRLCQY